jgi:prepilin-type N-terminal cleavage/methylation domain-containing protein
MHQNAHIRRRAESGGSPPRIGDTVRPGFTLIELLVAMSIMLILAVITIRLVGSTLDNDRLKSGSRELQSYLAGARDRATYAGQPRGVRLIPDPADPYSVRSFVYIGAPMNFSDGQPISLGADGQLIILSAQTAAIWQNLASRGQLVDGSSITLGTTTTPYSVARPATWTANTTYALNARIQSNPSNQCNYICTTAGTSGGTQPTWPTTTGATVNDGATLVWTEIATGNAAVTGSTWALTTPLGGSSGSMSYKLQLTPSVLPSEQPRSMPQNVAIDLRTSVLPTTWQLPPTANSTFDILFSPAGSIVGPVAASGRVHLVLADISDTATEVLTSGLSNRFQLNAPWQPSTPYVVGNVVVPNPSSFIGLRCTVAGTSGAAAAQPAWPTQPNQTVTDGSVTWQSFVKKANTIISVATATGRVTTHPVCFTPVWSPNSSYGLGALIQPNPANFLGYVCTTAGTSGATAPTWPTTSGGTVTDGSVVWTQSGFSPDSFRYAEIGEVTQ